jgi:tetratricopeptide (TPR) repeat protein
MRKPGPPNPMKQSPWIFVIAGAMGLALLSWLGPRVWESKVMISPHVPELPELTAWPAEAQERMLAADRAARSLWRARRGLAELARLYQANGLYDQALACYGSLREIEPGNARLYHLSAVILAGLGRLDEAESLFKRAAELAPDYLPAHLRTADVLLKTNQQEEARRMYENVLARFGEQPYALLGLSRVAIVRDEWDKAETLLQRAIAADANFVGGLSLLAAVYEHVGRKEDADRIAARVNRREFIDIRDPWVEDLADDCYDHHQLSVSAGVAMFRGDFVLSERWLERAASLAPNPAPYFRQLGQISFLSRNYTKAEENLAKAVQFAPTDDQAWTVWVNLLLAAGNRPKAYRVLSDGLSHCPESGALRYIHGHLLIENGEMARAIEELRMAKRFRSTQADVYLELARAYFRVDEADEAVAVLKEALAVQPNHPAVLPVLARIAIDRGNEAEAKAWIDQIRTQPKITAAEREGIQTAFRAKFGREP